MICTNCGKEVYGKFCSFCGKEVTQQPKSETDEIFDNVIGNFKEFKDTKGQNMLKLKDLFTDVFAKHTKEECDEVFIVGTSKTTPSEDKISSSWPKPWLYSRVFLMLAVTFVFLYICSSTFSNSNTIPGLIFMGSVAVPFSLLVFFWEANAPRNISIFDVIKMFFIGGVGSLVVTLFLFDIFSPGGDLNFFAAIIVGIVEEVGKLVIVAYFIKAINPKYILNGVLIGASIGAGFAAFESAGYALNTALAGGDMMHVIFLRGVLSGGGHIVWAAISGAGICLLKKENKFEIAMLYNKSFLKIFAVPVVLHAIWDMPIYLLSSIYFIPIVLTVVAWAFIFALINAGLKQISEIRIDNLIQINE